MSLKKLLAVLLTLTLLFAVAGCSTTTPPADDVAATRMDKIKAAGVMVVGTSADYPPFEFHAEIDGVDTIVGYDMMIAQYIADSLGVKLQIEDMAFDGLLISLQEDMFDIVLAGISENPTRAQAADFSVETTLLHWEVVMRKADDAKFNTVEDFADARIGVQAATVYEKKAIEMAGEKNVVVLATFPDLIIDLQNGTIDAIVANEMTTRAYASGNEDLMSKDVGIIHDEPGQSAAVMKGQPEWLAYVNEQITELRNTGKLREYLLASEALADASGVE